jgi:hypothetical protein
MTQTEELATQLPTYGRPVKFTPERVQQIKNLVEQEKSREEIAELIGVTVRSLKVTCSRLALHRCTSWIAIPEAPSCAPPTIAEGPAAEFKRNKR